MVYCYCVVNDCNESKPVNYYRSTHRQRISLGSLLYVFLKNTMVMEEQESDMELASESIPVPQVQEPVVDTIKRNNKSGVSRGKPRLRKKALHAAILKQMEFYFSDANLRKDRFFSGLLKESPYIDLEVFTRCNKLRELTTDTNRIAKALQGSTMLKVTEDGTKVYRLTQIQKKRNVDDCTVYVQHLPPDADHDWVISFFSKYGPVEYVSIPRYKSNKKIKGFAFVEFDTQISALKCIMTFQKKDRVLSPFARPHEILSITTYEETDEKNAMVGAVNSKAKLKDNEKEKAPNEEAGDEDNVCEMDTGDNNDRQSFKKKRHAPFVIDESDIKIKKKRKEAADQQNEKEKILKEESEDNAYDNEIDTADNDRQSLKKGKYVPEKSFVTDESDIKVKKKKKGISDKSITDQQNERGKVPKEESEDKDDTCDNEIDVADNNNRQSLRKRRHTSEKSLVTNENDIKVKKKKKAADESVADQQNEKEMVSKEEPGDKDNIFDNEIDTTHNDDRQNPKKKKFEKSCVAGDKNIKVSVSGNSDTENQEIPNKNRNKITEKKKRRHTISDTIIAEDISGEAITKECQKPTTKSNKNKAVESERLNEGDDSNEANPLLQTEKHSTRDFGMTNNDIEETSVDDRKKKKNRKKRSKMQGNDSCDMLGLQVASKKAWKSYRNTYLDLQRFKMSQLKSHLRKAEIERGGIVKDGFYGKLRQIHNTLHIDKLKHEGDNKKLDEEEKSCGRVNYAPGIIVKIEMDEPCTDVQSFKMELRDNNSVKYIDVAHGSCEAYIRCDTAEAAQSFAQKSHEGRRLTVLEDDEEKLYWDKISQDRTEKLSTKTRVKQRGRDKLLKRAEKELGKCIKFDQD